MDNSIIDRFNEEYDWKSILTFRKATDRGAYFDCPKCGSRASLSLMPISKAKKTNRQWVKCFKCGFKQDKFGAFMYKECIDDFGEAVKRAKEKMGSNDFRPAPPVTVEPLKEGEEADYSDYYAWGRANLWSHKDHRPLDYAHGRCISDRTLRLFDTAYDYHCDPLRNPGGIRHVEGQVWGKRLIFPTSKSHYIARDITGRCNPKYKVLNPSGSEVSIMGANLFFSPKGTGSEPLEENFVFVVEGAFDCLSIVEVGEKCVATNSRENGGILLTTLERMKPKGTTLIFIPDNDTEDHKRKETEDKFYAMRNGSLALGIPSYLVKLCQGTPFKDCNDFLKGDKAEFINRLQGTLRNARERESKRKTLYGSSTS